MAERTAQTTGDGLLGDLVAYLRQIRSQLQEEWARRSAETLRQSLTAKGK